MNGQIIRAQISQDLGMVTPSDSVEAGHIADVQQWLQSGANIFRIQKPDKPPKHLVSYFVVIDPEHASLLLGDHIKAQLWLPTGGHVELNEHPRQAVIREAAEELQMSAVFLRGNQRPFFVTVTQTVGLTAGHTDVSLWYLLQGSMHEPLRYDRREFADMAWFSFDDVFGLRPTIFDPHMQRFTKKLVRYLQQNNQKP